MQKNEKGGEKGGNVFEDDTDEAIVLPKPVPEVTDDGEKKDAAFYDQEIEVDEDEVNAEAESQPPGRKY